MIRNATHNFETCLFKGLEDDSSLEEDSTLKDKNLAWSENYSSQGSTSDLSTTSSELQVNLRGEKKNLIAFNT